MKLHLITLFPDACEAYLSTSILGRARTDKKISVTYQNPRDFVAGSASGYKKVDDKPYGGGPGMVMSALPVVKAVEKALKNVGRTTSHIKKPYSAKVTKGKRPAVVWFSPSAKQFTNKDADALLKFDEIAFVCGRYEGIDERAKKILKTLGTVKEFAVGEAVYTGGELPAMAMIDAMTRRIPGVLGKDASVEERRIASSVVYTRPETISYKKKNYKVPAVLKTGHHANIDAWRAKK
jgi:tRNA (guanine37-N1)-methyltransferase